MIKRNLDEGKTAGQVDRRPIRPASPRWSSRVSCGACVMFNLNHSRRNLNASIQSLIQTLQEIRRDDGAAGRGRAKNSEAVRRNHGNRKFKAWWCASAMIKLRAGHRGARHRRSAPGGLVVDVRYSSSITRTCSRPREPRRHEELSAYAGHRRGGRGGLLRRRRVQARRRGHRHQLRPGHEHLRRLRPSHTRALGVGAAPSGGAVASRGDGVRHAGLTAAFQCTACLNGHNARTGEILVTGAAGGVGSMALSILSHLGFSVVALQGGAGADELLKKCGAEVHPGRGRKRGPAVAPAPQGALRRLRRHGGAVPCSPSASSRS